VGVALAAVVVVSKNTTRAMTTAAATTTHAPVTATVATAGGLIRGDLAMILSFPGARARVCVLVCVCTDDVVVN
jgi:hypothetical protein